MTVKEKSYVQLPIQSCLIGNHQFAGSAGTDPAAAGWHATFALPLYVTNDALFTVVEIRADVFLVKFARKEKGGRAGQKGNGQHTCDVINPSPVTCCSDAAAGDDEEDDTRSWRSRTQEGTEGSTAEAVTTCTGAWQDV